MTAPSLCPPDGSDGPGGGGGFLPLLAASPRGPPVGRVRDLPAQPGLLRAPGRRPLLGVQQLVRQPRHLRFPVGELPKGLQAGVPLPDQRRRLAPQRHQGDAQQGGHPALHQLHQCLRRGETHPGGCWSRHSWERGPLMKSGSSMLHFSTPALFLKAVTEEELPFKWELTQTLLTFCSAGQVVSIHMQV